MSRYLEICRKVLAIGRNYRDHAIELGNEVPSKPVVFLKPPSSIILEGQAIQIPYNCKSLHHEVELAVVIGSKGKNIPEGKSNSYVDGYFLALDMTARDLQEEAKSKRQPWTISKGFDTSCPLSRFISTKEIKDSSCIDLWLKVNGQLRQAGNTKDMIFDISHLISYISKYFTLEPGDIILTGTPSGVGSVENGDIIEAGIGNLVKMTFSVESAK
ncbi:acylpyruvase FAHD1, mitochondrial [Octopus bimaculoides]|uniref:Oxaloacetate tautomerase FAHD1, mitochondrial n=1 Tax=Octopus bimaculoides TaxID=37653 RepID=A0A0L8GZH2_OCTBM|nr:acylpyruvase FAHD1, mitochondrial [Octopus bimaculoides]|eukprot:XP_014776756.1 PREDICTED: acylpyruvase FAHD1, mitochondrial-like [Octopus bimaculoides]